ncbi:MAG: hypothetical protein DU429_05105 [Candidatus Tokpelaia sp.]|nr:MAG: hypothetical protein DU430_07945 [Candidatus Tokpelaia sp.]KAA6206840.1 MAG: hypothetical protein DU429_05105 [Candidatus Tokpelaia sp.]
MIFAGLSPAFIFSLNFIFGGLLPASGFCDYFKLLWRAGGTACALYSILRNGLMTQKKGGKNVAGKKTAGKAGRKKLHKAILQAAEAAGKEFGEAGLVSYLQAQAVATPSPFLTLLGKVLTEAEDKTVPPVRRIELVAAAGAAGPEKESMPAVEKATKAVGKGETDL